jgi:two-component SAPR family response regulator
METPIACIPPERAIHASAQGAIVVVEDPYIRKYLRDVLTRQGYRVVGSETHVATEMLQLGTEQVDLVITNSPIDFLAFADTVPLLYIAGAPDFDLASRFLCCRVLKKPFHPEHLVAAVRDLTGSV